jgi:hypothetical protein
MTTFALKKIIAFILFFDFGNAKSRTGSIHFGSKSYKISIIGKRFQFEFNADKGGQGF